MKASVENLRKCEARMVRAMRGYEQMLHNLYPIGSRVEFKHGRATVRATVTMQGYGNRLRVVNINTGRERWIGAHLLLRKYGGNA